MAKHKVAKPGPKPVHVKPHTRTPRGADAGKPPVHVRAYDRGEPSGHGPKRRPSRPR
jgi:hypothetical protein